MKKHQSLSVYIFVFILGYLMYFLQNNLQQYSYKKSIPIIEPNYSKVVSGIPINISTNIGAINMNYIQVGILNPYSGKEDKRRILPLMGRPLFVSRNKWQYYTMTDKTNSINLPILYKGKSCTNEYGCDELLGGESVYVEGYNEAFKVTKYDNDTIRYIPFL